VHAPLPVGDAAVGWERGIDESDHAVVSGLAIGGVALRKRAASRRPMRMRSSRALSES
jgi:hypothetical protein